MKTTTIAYYPDIIIDSEDSYHDKLEITVRKKDVEFCCKVDGTGNRWTISKEVLKLMLEGKK